MYGIFVWIYGQKNLVGGVHRSIMDAQREIRMVQNMYPDSEFFIEYIEMNYPN